MKLVHKSTGEDCHKPFSAWLKETKKLEQEDIEHAAIEYEKMVRVYPLKEEGYDRLMIVYRKTKNYKREISIINKALKTFENRFEKPSRQLKGKKMISLSKSILKSMGLADEKGNPKYEQQPMARWNKRKQLIESRMKNFSG
jgi:hypothetical protein